VIGENLSGLPLFAHAWAGQAQPGMSDLALEIAMVPGLITRLSKATRRRRARHRRVRCQKEIVRIGVKDEVWRPVGVGCNHVEQGLLSVIGERFCDPIGAAGDRIETL
jgi:hypothetical protein